MLSPARLVLLCTCLPVLCQTADILALVVSNSFSHYNVMEPLLRTLAERGHRLTVVSSFPRSTPLHNYRDIDVSHLLIPVHNNLTFELISNMGKDPFSNMKVIWDAGYMMCENVFKSGVLHELYNSSAHFDLVIAHIFAYDCFSVFAHKFDTPVVSVVSSSALPWANPRVGNPDHPAYVINNYVDTDEHMGLYMRVLNTMAWLWSTVGFTQYCNTYSDQVIHRYLDASAPSTEEIIKRTSLVMVNSHFSILQSRPFVPNFVEIGGIHLKDPKPLPKDLQKWMDEAPDGVIVFSLGSLVRASSLPACTISALMQVFSALPQRVLMKFEEPLPDAPVNVLTRQWLPQRDILEHKNVRLLMAHGGQSSTIEAVVSGTPLIGFPLFSDQYSNIRSLVSRGAAELMDIQDINTAHLHQVLNKVLTDPSYKDNAMKLSRQFRDRPVSALDTAVYWTEYVLRHDGAPQLRSRSADIPWYQFLLLDVTAVLLFICFSVYYLVSVVVRYLYFSVRKLCTISLKCKFE